MKQLLMTYFNAKVPVIIWGPPGVGKTSLIEALAKELGQRLICANIRTEYDFALPVVVDGGVEIKPVNEFIDATRLDSGIVFVDEFSTLDESTQAAVLRFIDSGMVGKHRISPSVWRVAAANKPEHACNGNYLRPPVASRLAHVEYKLDAQSWASDFAIYWGNPPTIPGLDAVKWATARAMVAQFIRTTPQALLVLPRNEVEGSSAWACPRTWDMASKLIAATDQLKDIFDIVASCVGQAQASLFVEWYHNHAALPDPVEVLDNPSKWQLPERGDLVYITLGSVAAILATEKTLDVWTKVWKVIARAASKYPDVAAATGVQIASLRQSSWPIPDDISALDSFVRALERNRRR